MSTLALGKRRHPVRHRKERPLSRFIFAMKISRSTCAKTNHVERVSTQGRMFGLRISAGSEPAPSPLAFTGKNSDWLSQAFAAWRWFGMMRYRSATAADSHGFPRCLG